MNGAALSANQTSTPSGTGALPVPSRRFGSLLNRRRLALVLYGLLATVPFQGTRGLYETTEGRYAECARQTMVSGDIGTPVLIGEPHWSKPPLTYLLIMGGIKIFGCNTWAARAFLVPCFIFTVLMVYWLAGNMFCRDTAFISALVFASSPLPLASSNIVSTDPLLTAFIAAMLALFWKAVRTDNKWYMVLMWGAAGTAFMTKGPPALLPLLGIVPAILILKRNGQSVPRLISLPGLLLFAIIGLSWYCYQALEHPGLAGYWIGHEVVGRNITSTADRHSRWYGGFVIYLPVLALGAVNWLFLVTIFRRHWRPQRWPFKTPLTNIDGRWVFLITSIGLPLIVFMLVRSRLALYVLPLLVPLAVLLGRIVTVLLHSKIITIRTVVRMSLATGMLFIVTKFAFLFIRPAKDMKPLAEALSTISESSPQAPIYICGRELNGLQYYLEKEIPALSRSRLIRKLRSSGDRPLAPLVVAKLSVAHKLERTGDFVTEKTDMDNYAVLKWRANRPDSSAADALPVRELHACSASPTAVDPNRLH